MLDGSAVQRAAIAQGCAWTPLEPADEALHRAFAARGDPDAHSYEASWAFLTQETRHLGLKSVRGDALWFAVIRYDESPFVFVFPPVGSGRYRTRDVRAIDAELRALTQRRVVFRKVSELRFAEIMKVQEARSLDAATFRDARDVPEDVKPQVVVGVEPSVLRAGTHFMKVRNHIKRFADEQQPTVQRLSPANAGDVSALVARWNAEGRAHFASSDEPELQAAPANAGAYTIFAERFAERVDDQSYFARLVYVGGQPLGFVFAGRTSPESAALYSCLSLTRHRGASEFLMSCILADLHAAGVQYLNMGGSETDELFRYKSKFHVVALRCAFDVELQTASPYEQRKGTTI